MLRASTPANQGLLSLLSPPYKRLATIVLSVCALTADTASGDSTMPMDTGGAWVYTLEADYEDVRDGLVEAIEGRGMVLSYISEAEAMLSRTADTVGAPRVYTAAQVLMFCKTDLAHALVGESPHNLVLCPYSIAVYQLDKNPDMVYVGIRRPVPKVRAYAAIHQMLTDIVLQAISDQ